MSDLLDDIYAVQTSPASLGFDEGEDWRLGEGNVWEVSPRNKRPTVHSCTITLDATVSTNCGTESVSGHALGACSGAFIIPLSGGAGLALPFVSVFETTGVWYLAFNYGECNFQLVNRFSGICHQDCMCGDASLNGVTEILGADPNGDWNFVLTDLTPCPDPATYNLTFHIVST